MIKLKGDYGEGGGQIVRTALALATITGKEFTVDNIRKGRCKSGLKNQHLHGIKALQELTGANAVGAELGSENLDFFPGKIAKKSLNIDIGTAGSITLLMQSLLLPCMFAPHNIKLRIIGGTDTKWSMPVDYFKEVLIPHIKRYCEVDVKLTKRGYYPKGGGIVEIGFKPKYDIEGLALAPKLESTKLGELVQIKGVSHASKSLAKAEVADRQTKSAQLLLERFKCHIDIRTEYCDTYSDGSGVTLWAQFDNETEVPAIVGADSLGERGKRSEVVGSEAAQRLIRQIEAGAPIDQHLADNLIPLLGLIGGEIKVAEVTKHTLTNIYVVEKFLDVKFEVDEENRVIRVNK